MNFVFPAESLAIIKGLGRAKKQKASIFFFTTHKCASTFTPKVLACAARKLDLKHIDYARFLWHKSNDNVFDYMNKHAKKLFQAEGYVFAPLRQWIETRGCENSKVIIMLRDPRDVVVSMYYSMAYTHELPANRNRRKDFISERNDIVSMSIDDFVLKKSPHLLSVYAEYFLNLSKNKNYYFCTYEDMIFNFQLWITGLENYLGIKFDEEIKKIWQQQVTPPKIESLSHIRKMLPGDHRLKLQPETIVKLDEIFSEFINRFSYDEKRINNKG